MNLPPPVVMHEASCGAGQIRVAGRDCGNRDKWAGEWKITLAGTTDNLM
jgi:hypothetical protein